MPVFILSLIARAGIPARFQKAAAWIAALALVALLMGLLAMAFMSWLHGREDAAVQIDRKDVTIEAANRVINATSAATANQMERDDAFDNAQQELHHEVDTKGTADPVGPATAGVLARMREQQQAGRRGSTP